jgi:anaerobic ribonucleoside-triphosphate reductase activating protein
MYWQLNRVICPVFNLGPGKRIAIWVQGCSIKCKGCISSDLWSFSKGKPIDVQSFAAGILKIAGSLDGITITGGEPFDQYSQLIAFCSFLKLKSKIPVMVFTGYTLEVLKARHPDLLFTRCIDYLADGPFVEALQDDKNVRGSSNQKLYCFEQKSHRTKLLSGEGISIGQTSFPEASRKWSVRMDDCNQVFMTGIPAPGDFEVLKKQLIKTGIKFELQR